MGLGIEFNLREVGMVDGVLELEYFLILSFEVRFFRILIHNEDEEDEEDECAGP